MPGGAQMGGGCQRMRANRKVIETNCKTCGGTFAFGEEVCSCEICGAYQHAKCWGASPGCLHESAAMTPAVGTAPVVAQAGAASSKPEPGQAGRKVDGTAAESALADSNSSVLVKTRPVFCVECGSSIEHDWKLCPRCGTQVENIGRVVSQCDVVCQRCGSRVLPGAGYVVYPEAAQGATADHRVFLATTAPGSFEAGDSEIRRLDIALYCEACASAVFTEKVWDQAKDLRVEMELQDTTTSDGRQARLEVLDFAIALPAKRRGITPEQARKEARELGQLWWKDQNAARQRLTGANATAAPEPLEAGKPKDCPHCRLINPGSAARCDCGYDFILGKMGSAPAAAAEASPSAGIDQQSALVAGRALAADEQYCSQCREVIKLGALKCRFCGYVLNAQLNSGEMSNQLAKEVDSQANKALWCGIIGLFICGPILGSVAISSGNKAIETMDMYPLYPGPRGRANTGRVLGWIAWGLFVIYIIGMVSKTH